MIFTLALGLGSAIAIFGVVYAFLFRPLPFSDSDRLLMLYSSRPNQNFFNLGVSIADLEDWRRGTIATTDGGGGIGSSAVLEGLAGVSVSRAVSLAGREPAEHLSTEFVSGNFFSLLGVEAQLGRTFSEEEDSVPMGHPVVILSHGLWQRVYAGDPGVIGQEMILNDRSFTVIGVLGPDYRGTWWDPIDLWLPITMGPVSLGDDFLTDRSRRMVSVVAKMSPGVTLSQANEALNTIAEELEKDYPASNADHRVNTQTLRAAYFDYVKPQLWTVLGAGALLLLLCSFNVASLLLTRGASRRNEIAVRGALGAGRGRLLMEKLVDSSVLALAGGALGLLLAALFTDLLVGLSTIPTMNFHQSFMSGTVAAMGFALTVVTGIFFGVAPAIQTFGSSLWKFLKQGSKLAPSRGFRRLLDGLLALEVALALLILVAAAEAVGNYLDLRNADIGMATDELLTARLDFTAGKYQEDPALRQGAMAILDRVAEIPGVASVGLVGPYAPPQAVLSTSLTIEDRLSDSAEAASLRVYRQYISADYFSAVGIPMEKGRQFTHFDNEEMPLVAVVSELLAERAWPGKDPLGQRLRMGLPDSESPWITVVGVADNVRSRGPKDLGRGPDYDIYFPYLQNPSATPFLMVRSNADPSSLAESVRKAIHDFDLEIPVYETQPLRERLAFLATDDRFLGVFQAIFAVVGSVVAAVGLFGILSYAVGLRTREFGVRRAMGASESKLVGLVLKQGVLVTGTGLLLGWVAVTQLAPRIFGTGEEAGELDVGMAISMTIVLAVMAIAAMIVPAVRATQITPTEALRYE